MAKKRQVGDIFLIVLAVVVSGALLWCADLALSRHDDPEQMTWTFYKVPENMYLWELATKLADKFNKDPQVLVRLIRKKNRINKDFFLQKGDGIEIPLPLK